MSVCSLSVHQWMIPIIQNSMKPLEVQMGGGAFVLWHHCFSFTSISSTRSFPYHLINPCVNPFLSSPGHGLVSDGGASSQASSELKVARTQNEEGLLGYDLTSFPFPLSGTQSPAVADLLLLLLPLHAQLRGRAPALRRQGVLPRLVVR